MVHGGGYSFFRSYLFRMGKEVPPDCIYLLGTPNEWVRLSRERPIQHNVELLSVDTVTMMMTESEDNWTYNGRSFTSLTFQEFLKSCGTQHKTTAPFHPSSNGQAERFVQTVKKMLKSILDEPGTLDSKIHKAIIQLRQVPNSTGNSAYYLMFNRQVRTYLSVMIPSRIEDSKDKPKGITRIFKVGDRVQVRNYYKGQTKWSFGKVTSRDGNLHYNVELENGVTCRRHVDQMLRSRL
ncbi:uncharacterized protein K02A2.6-like [Macrosteles quadrilineatus]|uniref:uncharacterized protein K02A2.6-like n=1 Tax=Macrosteles quadrilineatus TaxID=74068 RepID=UPI0023E287B0|nr:uncharacterized protein K02A2.6-like [Macrosteles quadrilineatus]